MKKLFISIFAALMLFGLTSGANATTITTSVDAPIFGFIPYSVEKKYPAQEFQNMIKNPPPGTFDCLGL